MALHFRCPACGEDDTAPAAMAGQKAYCRKCGQKVRLPAARDAQRPQEPQPTEASLYTCSDCGGQFNVADVYDQQGTVICKACFSIRAQQAEDVAMVAASRQSAPIRGRSGAAAWLIGGGMATAVVVGAVILIRAALNRQAAQRQPVQTTVIIDRVVRQEPAPPAPPPLTPAQAWEKANRQKLDDLRQGASDLVAAGDFGAAADSYRRLIALANSAPNQDAVRAQIAEARDAIKSIRARLATTNPSGGLAGAPSASSSGHAVVARQADNSWEQQHRLQIEMLLSQAQALRGQSDRMKWAASYQSLFDLVGPHIADIHDAALKKKIQDAAVTRAKLLTQMKSSSEAATLTAKSLVASGMNALQRGQWTAGLESLTDARTIFDRTVRPANRAKDPDYVLALHGMAVAYLHTKQVPRAGELFDSESQPLGKAIAANPTRELVVNRAVVDILQKTKAVRAAKSIKDYLEKHPPDADEPMLNLLFTAIAVGEQHSASKSFLAQCEQFYDKLNEQLESRRPGESRWGVQWFPAAEAEQRRRAHDKAIAAAQDLSRRAQAAQNEWERQKQLYQPSGPERSRHTTIENVDAAERQYNGLVAAASEAWRNIPQPPILTELSPELPVSGMQPTAIAMADPVGGPSRGTRTGSNDAHAGLFTIPRPDSTSPPGESSASSSDSTGAPADSADSTPKHDRAVVAGQRHALAFAVGATRLVSAADVIGDAAEAQLADAHGNNFTARVVAKDGRLALLEVDPSQVPGRALHYLNLARDFAGGKVRCAAIPEENIFAPAPKLLDGTAAPPPAEQGEWFASLSDHPRLPGSPLINADSEIVGVVFPVTRDDARTKLRALDLNALRQFLAAHAALPSTPSATPDPLEVFEVTSGG